MKTKNYIEDVSWRLPWHSGLKLLPAVLVSHMGTNLSAATPFLIQYPANVSRKTAEGG